MTAADGHISSVHIAFRASSENVVREFHRRAIEAGGIDNGTPGDRGYHEGYFAAYVLDPDGNNIDAVFNRS